jgi:hypothetical protein
VGYQQEFSAGLPNSHNQYMQDIEARVMKSLSLVASLYSLEV